MVHVKKLKIRSDDNLGMYGFATDSYCLLGRSVEDEKKKQIADVLQVPTYSLSLCGTPLVGIFAVGNEHTIIVPNIVFESERDMLEEIAQKHDLKIIYLNTLFTALGNVLAVQDSNIVCNTELEDEAIAQLTEAGFKIKQCDIADTDVVGSSIVVTSKGGLIHPHILEDLGKEIEKFFGKTFTLGTVNYGSPYVRTGIIANGHGFVIGSNSSGPEITNADEAFGFVGGESQNER